MTQPIAGVGVCHGPRCKDYGGLILADQLKCQGIEVEVLSCQSLCSHFPMVRLNHRMVHRASVDRVIEQLSA